MIGIDLVLVERVREACKNGAFLEGIFSPAEIEYCYTRADQWQSFAGLFAAKEAVVKAMGEGITDIHLKNIEVFHDELGAPYAMLNGLKFELSISHEQDYAAAVALLVK